MRGARRRPGERQTISLGTPEGPGRDRSPRSASTGRSTPPSTRWRGCCRRPSSRRRSLPSAAQRVCGRQREWQTRSAAGSSWCWVIEGWWSMTRPIRPSSRWPRGVRPRTRAARRNRAPRRRCGQRLVERGYHAQVSPHERVVALFDLDGGRRPIRIDGGQLHRRGRAVRSGRAGRPRAAAGPSHFSPNVLLRPVVQDTLFPTVAYVPGPNELAYLAQLKPVYDALRRADAARLLRGRRPRSSTRPAMRFLNRYPVPFERCSHDDEALLNHLLESAPAPVGGAGAPGCGAVRSRGG